MRARTLVSAVAVGGIALWLVSSPTKFVLLARVGKLVDAIEEMIT
jgi:hypothetical protein